MGKAEMMDPEICQTIYLYQRKLREKVYDKIAKSKEVVRQTFKRFGPDKTAIAWSGGKDSTTMLWIIRQVCLEDSIKLPKVISIEEGDSFPEMLEHISRVTKEWSLNQEFVCNTDVLNAAKHTLKALIRVKDLNDRNRAELQRIGFAKEEFIFEPESPECNHLMKTVPVNEFIERNNVSAIFTAIRWDEHPSRRGDDYFTLVKGGYLQPEHWRIEPILHFLERDIWNTIFAFSIPFCSLYAQGYRSLGVKSTTKKFSDVPAWLQDLERTDERGGRFQEKEKVMERLRKLGYM